MKSENVPGYIDISLRLLCTCFMHSISSLAIRFMQEVMTGNKRLDGRGGGCHEGERDAKLCIINCLLNHYQHSEVSEGPNVVMASVYRTLTSYLSSYMPCD